MVSDLALMSLFPMERSFAQKGISPQRYRLSSSGFSFEMTASFGRGAVVTGFVDRASYSHAKPFFDHFIFQDKRITAAHKSVNKNN